MRLKFWLTVSFSIIVLSLMYSQPKYGFKAGLNLSSIVGPSEVFEGKNLESSSLAFGFHAGAFMRVAFTDRVGLHAEFLYTQKGGAYRYEGQSFSTLLEDNKTIQGNRIYSLNTINTYLDIPALVYIVAIPGKLEFAAGPNIGFMVGSQAIGNTKFTSNDGAQYEIDLDFKYYTDKGEAIGEITREVINDQGSPVTLPTKIQAYYKDSKVDNNVFYNPIDLGINLDVIFRFGSSLRLGIRGNYSLLDVSNNVYDNSRIDGSVRNDIDRNLSFSAYLGFSF